MFGRKGKKGNYAYTVARVKAKKSALLKEDAYSKMLMTSSNTRRTQTWPTSSRESSIPQRVS